MPNKPVGIQFWQTDDGTTVFARLSLDAPDAPAWTGQGVTIPDALLNLANVVNQAPNRSRLADLLKHDASLPPFF